MTRPLLLTLGLALSAPAVPADAQASWSRSVSVEAFDVLERRVAAVNGTYGPGPHQAALDLDGHPGGVYLVRVTVTVDGAAPLVRVAPLTVSR